MPRQYTPRLERTCPQCEAPFTVQPSEAARGRGKFCSDPCSRNGRRLNGVTPIVVDDDGITANVPLCRRDGSIRAYALIDAADVEWAGRWRWCYQHGYASREQTIDGRVRHFSLHRELLGLTAGDGLEGDHINRDTLDDRRSNLRRIPKGAQAQNVPSMSGSTSRFRGVTWAKDRGKWRAQINLSGDVKHLGHFDDEEEAAQVALEARLRLLPYAVD